MGQHHLIHQGYSESLSNGMSIVIKYDRKETVVLYDIRPVSIIYRLISFLFFYFYLSILILYLLDYKSSKQLKKAYIALMNKVVQHRTQFQETGIVLVWHILLIVRLLNRQFSQGYDYVNNKTAIWQLYLRQYHFCILYNFILLL